MKIIKMIKRYRWSIILATIVFILVVAMILSNGFLFYNNGSTYGNRLDGINQVPIKEDLKNDIINNIKRISGVDTSSLEVRGKIVDIVVKLKSTADVDTVKTKLEGILIKFSEDQITFYDIQFFVSKGDITKNNGFVTIGYKNKNSEVIVWSGSK